MNPTWILGITLFSVGCARVALKSVSPLAPSPGSNTKPSEFSQPDAEEEMFTAKRMVKGQEKVWLIPMVHVGRPAFYESALAIFREVDASSQGQFSWIREGVRCSGEALLISNASAFRESYFVQQGRLRSWADVDFTAMLSAGFIRRGTCQEWTKASASARSSGQTSSQNRPAGCTTQRTSLSNWTEQLSSAQNVWGDVDFSQLLRDQPGLAASVFLTRLAVKGGPTAWDKWLSANSMGQQWMQKIHGEGVIAARNQVVEQTAVRELSQGRVVIMAWGANHSPRNPKAFLKVGSGRVRRPSRSAPHC